MRYSRRLLLAWTIGSLAWVGYWLWHYGSNCRLERIGTVSGGARDIACHWARVTADGPGVVGQTAPMMTMLKDMAVTTFAGPAWILAAGLVIYWGIALWHRRS